MTPAINTAKKANIIYKLHEYEHAPQGASFGMEAAQKLGVNGDRVFKTLIVCLDQKELAVAIVPVTRKLSLKLTAKAFGAKKSQMAEPAEVERSTGYVLGGVSPLGQKKCLRTVIDTSACELDSLFVSAGRRGLEIELGPETLKMITRGHFSALCSND